MEEILSAAIGPTVASSPMTAVDMDVEHSETTTDSGVQLSESTEMNASMMISGGFDDESPTTEEQRMQGVDSGEATMINNNSPACGELTKSDIENSNIPTAMEHKEPSEEPQLPPPPSTCTSLATDDAMVSSQCSTFDTNEVVTVHRRRPKKSTVAMSAPKKRVSFHEDILKNTKTDNIHIEHGFITYKGAATSSAAAMAGRYSWCAKGSAPEGGLLQDSAEDPDYVIYRNACSEVLDYGKTDIYDGEGERPQCDNSGVFEYADSQNGNHTNSSSGPNEGDQVTAGVGTLYQCHCSDSSSSLEDNAVDVNSNQMRGNYVQTKSSSCECIGQQANAQNAVLNDNCYYSEPNIGRIPASVWSKEKKPKSSCLKKTKYSSFEHQSQEAVTAKSNALQRFNVHSTKTAGGLCGSTPSPKVSMTNLLDNGKSIFGSLKNIFGMPLPERGVPEGQEDAEAVNEEGAAEGREEEQEETEPMHSPIDPSPVQASRSFLSKSFDGGLHEKHSSPNKKTFIHTVDEQLRKKGAAAESSSSLSPKRSNQMARSVGHTAPGECPPPRMKQEVYRNKFIVNCESTVFEHTGVSYCYEGGASFVPPCDSAADEQHPLPKVSQTSQQSYLSQKISSWTNMFRSTAAEQTSTPPTPTATDLKGKKQSSPTVSPREEEKKTLPGSGNGDNARANDVMECSFASSSHSTVTDASSLVSTPTTTTAASDAPLTKSTSGDGFSKIFGASPSHSVGNNRTPTRHLASPRRRKSSGQRMSPDLFNNYVQLMGSRAPTHDLRTSSLLSEDFDDILTVTTTSNEGSNISEQQQQHADDLVIVDYPEITIPDHPDDSDFLKPPSSKSSLINRFLRNVTQKKIMEATVALNRKLAAAATGGRGAAGAAVTGQLYVRGVRPMSRDLIEDLNAEIAMEIEQSKGVGGEEMGPREGEGRGGIPEKRGVVEFDLGHGFGVGEIPVATFRDVQFPFIGALLPEFLMKVFKLYIGYDREGIMTPVLVFLTNKTLYVTDLVRSKLCNKFVMPYAELDVILLGPYGNTVLLCNGDRDMQQVLLAGGPNQANSLVGSLEICARRGGLQLPAIGQLTLDHLAPLQHFVRDNSKTVDKREKWLYYAVVSISPVAAQLSAGAAAKGEVEEQLGANINGPLMHRSMSKAGVPVSQWSASYFLLKAGVLYMFPTTTATVPGTQRLPSWAVTLTECQGVRRMLAAGRPHCFELLLKTGALQLAACDEYAASDWMQALVQSASGLFELEEKRSHYGCTLVLTSSHIITLREEFTEPLKRQAAVASGSSQRKKGGEGPVSGSAAAVAGKQPKEKTRSGGGGNYGKMFSEYGKDSGMEILSCADIGELVSVKVSAREAVWWCSLEFSCQECVQENSDVVVHFATENEHQRFLATLQEVWSVKTKDGGRAEASEFPLQRVREEEDAVAEHCTKLFTDINRMWDPLVTAALGYPK